ncbi:MAG: amino acid ABC transporter substrate-binding protein [Streptococcaceae bacterium]|jgi:polar amino acid transport system substrate-binding protein|nr:amino acid ABC transporter substrate-binding protein [Streptococcaceae bacterium]
MKKLKKIILAMAALIAVITLAACSGKTTTSNTWDKIQKESNKTITIGFDDTFAPMGFKDTSGNFVGFDIDLANAVFKKYGITVKWQPINWSMKEQNLKNGQIDLIWNGYGITPEREKIVLFSKPYMYDGQVLITPKSSGITSTDAMKGKLLGMQSGSSQLDAFNAQPNLLKNSVKNSQPSLYNTFDASFADLKAGRIQGILSDEVYGDYYLTKSGQTASYALIATKYESQGTAVGARQSDTELIDKINTAIADLHKDGTFQKISEKWFSKDVYPTK